MGLFKELETMGYAKVVGKTLIPVEQDVDHVEPMLKELLNNSAVATSIDTESIQPLTDINVENVDHFSKAQLEEPFLVVDPELLTKDQHFQQINKNSEGVTQPDVENVEPAINSPSTYSEMEGKLGHKWLDDEDYWNAEPATNTQSTSSEFKKELGGKWVNEECWG